MERPLFDTFRFFFKVLDYHRISKLPRSARLRMANQRWQRMDDIVKRIPFYRDRMSDSAREPHDFPPFDKSTYHQWAFAQRVADPHPDEFAKRVQEALYQHADQCEASKSPIKPFQHEGKSYLAYSTSGSSGRTIALVKSLPYLEDLVALQIARGSAEPKTLINAWRKWRSPPRWAVLLRGPGAFPGISLLSNQPGVARSFVEQRVYDIASLAWEKVKAEVLGFQPSILTTYPSTLLRIAQENWPLANLKLAVTMSEPFTATMKRSVQKHFPDTVLSDHYAMGECPILTTACPAGRGAHVNDDLVVCQPCRKDGTPCADKEISAQVLITDLLNEVQPFIHYIIEDQIVMSGNAESACECGSLLPLVVAVEGRNNDKIKLPSGFVIDNVFLRGLVTRYPSIVDYQLVYADSRPPRMKLNLVLEDSGKSEDAMASCRIAEMLSKSTPDRITCKAQVLPALPVDEKTGKSQRFVFSAN